MKQVFLGFAALLWTYGTIVAQDTQSRANIVKLDTPVYPPMAIAARVSGDVNLDVTLASDGTASTVAVQSGPPMLRQAAVDSATRSQFRANVEKPSHSYLITYRFVLDSPTSCERDRSYPRVKHEGNVVTITEKTILICDPSDSIERVRFRSAKCLYLWKCGSKGP